MTETLNPDALKLHRNKRGWSQDQLADATNISKTQISRWERGKQTARIRSHSREQLCAALGVKWEQLTRAPEKPDIAFFRNRVPLKGGIDGSARTFLTLMQRHYGLIEDAIIDLAPLAFLILAERSLRARQTALDQTLQSLDAATGEAHRRLPYMRAAFWDHYDHDWVHRERKSIEESDVFEDYRDEDGEELSSFINFLQDELKELGLFQESPIEFESRYRTAPYYEVPMEVLGSIVGLDPGIKPDRSVLGWIQHGQINLGEVSEKKDQMAEEDYRRWIDEKYRSVTEELRARMPRLHRHPRKDDLPGNQSKKDRADSSNASTNAQIDSTNAENCK
ncbi:helix-turn-helix transcriptional regulator [uncultured Thiodictyon sp.]|uniref:helix-turn-helix domain-containing protein n=1 Tax=uncultured Thiodictyon sp. TaxID=1846217 RepID=UPI0025DEE171|nr:helix-turn-helix transcriptional regulator [uncultured Thiodictyon sp.]